jgi:hypothetical protein
MFEESRRGGPGSGDGSGGGVDHRVARLEGDVSDLRKQVTDSRLDNAKSFGEVKATLATLDERTKHLPTRWETFLILVAVLGLVSAVLAITSRFVEFN